MLFVLTAGELSGDILGAGLITALQQRYPHARFVGIAGPNMQAAGCESLFPLETLSVMGVTEVLKHLPAILKVRKGLIEYCLSKKPVVYIGIDAPDFNLGVEKRLKAAGIKTVQYVSPSIWAWREKRIHTVMQASHLVLCLLPFEPALYEKYRHPAKFVGHPQADLIPLLPDQASARSALGLMRQGKYLAILPGSRRQELKALLSPFLQTAAACRNALPELQFILPVARESLREELRPYQAELKRLNVTITSGLSHEVIAAADVVLLASGTATLETLLFKRPMVVAYRLSRFSFWLARCLIKVKYIALPNLLANDSLVPEFIQDDVSSSKLAPAILQYFNNVGMRTKLVEKFNEIHEQLKCDANEQAALAISQLVG